MKTITKILGASLCIGAVVAASLAAEVDASAASSEQCLTAGWTDNDDSIHFRANEDRIAVLSDDGWMAIAGQDRRLAVGQDDPVTLCFWTPRNQYVTISGDGVSAVLGMDEDEAGEDCVQINRTLLSDDTQIRIKSWDWEPGSDEHPAFALPVEPAPASPKASAKIDIISSCP